MFRKNKLRVRVTLLQFPPNTTVSRQPIRSLASIMQLSIMTFRYPSRTKGSCRMMSLFCHIRDGRRGTYSRLSARISAGADRAAAIPVMKSLRFMACSPRLFRLLFRRPFFSPLCVRRAWVSLRGWWAGVRLGVFKCLPHARDNLVFLLGRVFGEFGEGNARRI